MARVLLNKYDTRSNIAWSGKRGVFTPDTMKPNLGGPSDRTLTKHSSGYTTESGIINPLLIQFHDLALKSDSVIMDSQIVKVLSVHAEKEVGLAYLATLT